MFYDLTGTISGIGRSATNRFGVRRHVAALKARTRPRTPNSYCRELPVAAITSAINWPHAPTHWLFEPGLYIVTAGTYRKLPHLNSPLKLDFFQESLFECAREFGWHLRAWAVLANHYHFVAASPSDPHTLRKFLGKLHMQTAKQLNLLDNTSERKVWFQFWESRITFERSYLARLNYVHHNPAQHRVVPLAEKLQMVFGLLVCTQCSACFCEYCNELQNRPRSCTG